MCHTYKTPSTCVVPCKLVSFPTLQGRTLAVLVQEEDMVIHQSELSLKSEAKKLNKTLVSSCPITSGAVWSQGVGSGHTVTNLLNSIIFFGLFEIVLVFDIYPLYWLQVTILGDTM